VTETGYARVGTAHIAYRTWGEGPVDFLLFAGEYMPVDSYDEEPRLARCFHRLASLGRVIIFNRRGVGLSDAPDGPLTQEQFVEDALAVADKVEAMRPVVFGWNVGGPAAILFAARYRERTTSLILVNTAARLAHAPDYPIGIPMDVLEQTAEQTTSVEPSEGFDFLTVFAPSVANDERFRAWWERAGHRGASPARSNELWGLVRMTDVRDVLDDIEAPTLVVSSSDLMGGDTRHYVAEHIRGARYVELPGRDLLWWVGDANTVLDQIETFLASAGTPMRAQRRLATVLFVDVVGSTEQAVALGDLRWREVLATYHELAERELHRAGGNQISTAGDGFVATFDMPADAVRCAQQIAGGVGALDIDVRAGVHTGEIEIVGDDVAGIGVHIAARVMSAAAPGEVLVSRTVADLVTGSGLAFEDRGEHELKGVPGRWQLFAVKA
jgi:class 3 adenylate cyclase/alpha-beta hydrolase superfamily lysophospholipase